MTCDLEVVRDSQLRMEGQLSGLAQAIGQVDKNIAFLAGTLADRPSETPSRISFGFATSEMAKQDEPLNAPDVVDADAPCREGTVNSGLNVRSNQDSKSGCGRRLDDTMSLGQEVRRHRRASSMTSASSEVDMMENRTGFICPTLPLNWPAAIEVRGAGGTDTSIIRGLTRSGSVVNYNDFPMGDEPSWGFLDPRYENCILRQCRNPDSNFNFVMEILLVIVLAHDLTVVPYILAWQVRLLGLSAAMSFTSLVFWTSDLIMNFIRGYYEDGTIVVQPLRVAQRYLKTWFSIDFSIVFCEWVSVILASFEDGNEEAAGSMKVLRLVKIGKMLRLLSALRIVRLVRILETLIERSVSEMNRMLFRIGSLVLFFVWCNHMLCCAWFAIGNLPDGDPNHHWIQHSWTLGDGASVFLDAGPLFQYVTALHWSMAQTTLGAMEITPVNASERIFNIFCLTLGLIFGSTLVSSLSAMMVEVQARGRDRAHKLLTLRRYLNENRVERHVSLKVQKQVLERLGQRDALTEKDVDVLQIMSASLQQELRGQVCWPHAVSHPLIHTFAIIDMAWFRRLCTSAATIFIVRTGDDIFVAGAEASSGYFNIAGGVSYTQEPESSAVMESETTEVCAKTWFSEMAWWSEWVHVGTAQAADICQILSLTPEGMWEAFRPYVGIMAIAREYCEIYHRCIATAAPPDASYPTDLEVPFADHGDIVCSMTLDAQQQIGMSAITQLTRSALPTGYLHKTDSVGSGQAKLETEIMEGKSVVILNSVGRPERVVSIVVLNLSDTCGKLFSQVGSIDAGGRRKAKCVLPAIKRQRNELILEALKRMLASKLKALDGHTQLKSVENKLEEKESKDVGVLTKYMRTICHATMPTSLDGKVPVCELQERLAGEADSNLSLDQAVLTRFADKLVFPFLQEDGSATLFAWLSTVEHDHLASGPGEHELGCWIRALRLPELPSDCGKSETSAQENETIDI